MSEVNVFSSSADLFSASIDDLADLPSYETPPPGVYILTVSTDVKKINDKDAVEASFTVVETVELLKAEDKPVLDGTKFSTAFMLGNEYGVGNLKKFLAPFAEHFSISNIGQLIQEIKDVEISGKVTNRTDKNDASKVYASVIDITVA